MKCIYAPYTIQTKKYRFCIMIEYCVYWTEYGEPRHKVFSNLSEAEMYSCTIRGVEGVEYVDVSEEETIDFDELQEKFPEDFF